ncbi:MAG: DEAD/DEAH box helicase [Alphaproteobacteria bacterium]|nr:DEAD/DEAH box helicase [Alphaproteobacteria bacterium]
MSFDELGLSAEVLRAIAEAGYTTPTPIQAKAIPVALSGRDLIGIAQTGTGKTAGFTLPMIEKLAAGRAKARMPRSLVLEPTRELAAQVAESFEKYGRYHKLSMALLIGGVSFGDQDAKIDRGVDVLIATPGRLLDHFERGKLLLNGVQKLVIDEADRMLDMGFIPDIERICKLLPPTRQTLFFSATMPPEIKRLTEQFLRNPERIEVSKPATAATTIEQKVVGIPGHDPKLKREALRRVIRGQNVVNAIIFCNRKRDVDIVYKSLSKHGFSVGVLHGDLPQPVRMKTLEGFRNGDVQLMVASDVAARGLDLPQVSHVFNYDVPIHADDYVHRIGRTGRAGRAGHAFMLAAPSDHKWLSAIEKLIGKAIEREEMEGLEGISSGEREHGHGRDRDRRGRGRSRDRRSHDKQRAEVNDQPPALAELSAPTSADDAPRESKPRRHEKPKQEHHAKAQQKPKKEPRKPDADPKGDRMIGMGDHTPAFLLKPVPQHLLRKKKKVTEAA